MKKQKPEIRSQRSAVRSQKSETETTFQVERRLNGKNGWEQLAPVIKNCGSAVKALRSHAFLAQLAGSGDSFRLVKTVRAVAALLLALALSLQPSAFSSDAPRKPSAARPSQGASQHRPATITCPPSAGRHGDGKPPSEPFITRYDPRATNFDEVPGPGLREDLRLQGETWPFVKFGPVKVGRDGRHYIFIHAHRSAWVAAADLPECIRTRLRIPVR